MNTTEIIEQLGFKHSQVYVDKTLVRGRVITLRNITLWYDDGRYCDCDVKCTGWVPEYFAIGKLTELVVANPDINDYTFDLATKTWKVTIQ